MHRSWLVLVNREFSCHYRTSGESPEGFTLGIKQINSIRLNESSHGRDNDGASECKLQPVPPR